MVGRRVAVHLTVLAIGASVLRVAVVPAEVCPPVTPAQVEVSIESATQWLVAGMAPDGTYFYGYDRVAQRVNPGYNDARHAGVTMSLYQVYEATGDESVLDAADRGLEYALERLVDHGDWSAWRPGGDIPVGANGLLTAALAIRRRATADTSRDELMRRLGRFLLDQQFADGSVSASWSVTDAAPRDTFGPFATGEAAWALALLDGAFPGEGWGEAAGRTLDYMATERNRKEGYLASLPDHWAAYTLAELRPDLVTEARIDYARRLAGFFGIRLRFEAQRRGTGINLWLRWYPGPPAGVGTAGEGLGALYRLSLRDERLADVRGSMEERLACTAAIMVQRQEPPASPSGDLEAGAWFYRGYTQMDDQQHVLSALLAALPALIEEE